MMDRRTEQIILLTGMIIVGCMTLVGIIFMVDVQDEHRQMLALLHQILANTTRVP